MSKRNLPVLLSLLLCCALLAACGGADAGSAPEPQTAAQTSGQGEDQAGEDAGPAEPDSGEAPGAGQEDAAEAVPIGADRVADGVYEIDVSSSSSMFRIVRAELTVADGAMRAVLTLSGTGYEKLYMGTGEQALEDSDDACIYFVEDDEGLYTYTVPVEALDRDTDVAAWSYRKQTWYDRVLVFESDRIPEEAIAPE